MTGVEVPKYYNPAAVNPIKYAEQVQKRKLLWSKKTEEKDKNVSYPDPKGNFRAFFCLRRLVLLYEHFVRIIFIFEYYNIVMSCI